MIAQHSEILFHHSFLGYTNLGHIVRDETSHVMDYGTMEQLEQFYGKLQALKQAANGGTQINEAILRHETAQIPPE